MARITGPLSVAPPGVLTLVLALLPMPGTAAGQSAVFPESEPREWARMEAGRPGLENVDGASVLSAAWFLTLYLPIPGDVVMVLDLPVAYLHRDHESVTALGNPYVGARLQFPDGVITEFEVGVRLPLAPETNAAMSYAMWADLADRGEAFQHRALPLVLRAVRSFGLGGAAELNLAAGSIWWLMAGPDHTEQNAFLTYSGQLRGQVGRLHLTGGASGRYLALGSAIPALTGTTGQASGSADIDLHGVRPGIFVVVPLSEPATDRLPATVGLRALVPLGGRR
jgi:hypothetical protein